MATFENKNLKTSSIVKKLKEKLIREGIWHNGLIEIPKIKTKNDLEALKQKIEFALLTARDFQNLAVRFIKKKILSILRVYTKSQIVFNNNILFLLEDIYRYLQILEKRQKK